jgi:hypothetical protein
MHTRSFLNEVCQCCLLWTWKWMLQHSREILGLQPWIRAALWVSPLFQGFWLVVQKSHQFPCFFSLQTAVVRPFSLWPCKPI